MASTSDSTVRQRAEGELDDEQRAQFEQIVDEITPMAEDSAVSSALSQLDRMLEQMPDDSGYRHLRAGLYALRGSLLLDADRPEEALECAEAAIEAGWKDVDVYETAGWATFSLDRPGAARDYFQRAIQFDADAVSALTGRALALQEIDELDQARSDLTHAINVEGEDPTLYAMRAETQIGLGHLEEAERDIRRARELDPSEVEYAVDLARVLMVQQQTDAARQVLEEDIDGESDEVELETLLLRSHLRLLAGDADAAKTDAIRASNAYPDEAFAFVQLVHVEMAEGNLTLARKAADRAVRLDPSLPDGYMVRGSVRQMLGEQEAAQEDLEKASQEPAELPMFLLGPFYDVLDQTSYNASMQQMLQQYAQMGRKAAGDSSDRAAGSGAATGANPFGAMGIDPEDLDGMPGFGADGDSPDPGDFDPANVMEQMFDDSGELDDRVKPLLEMALQNAPNMLKNMPPGMLENLPGVDADELQDLDLDDVDSDELESRMKQVYEMLQGGQNPFDMFGGGGGPSGDAADDDDNTGRD